jgi:hypothetical protein
MQRLHRFHSKIDLISLTPSEELTPSKGMHLVQSEIIAYGFQFLHIAWLPADTELVETKIIIDPVHS